MFDVRRGTVLSFSAADWTALVLLDGSDQETQMPVGQWVPAAMMAANAEVAVIIFGGTNTDDGLVLGPYGAVSLWNYPAIGAAANGQLLIGNGAGLVLAALTGTANRVTVTNGAGAITLSGPQDLATTSGPTFDNLNLGSASGAASGELRASSVARLGGVTDVMLTHQKINSLAVNSKATLLGGAAHAGLLVIVENLGGRVGVYALRGGGHATDEIADPGGVFSPTLGTGANTNLYWSGTVYELENKSAGINSYYITFMGT